MGLSPDLDPDAGARSRACGSGSGSGSGLSPWPCSGVLVLAAQVMICSTSLSGGNLVDGLPPASSWAEKDKFIFFGRKFDFSI